MFASIIVVLPSQFSGGAAHLSHSGLSTVYDCSASSLLETTVMSWYTDVTHEIKPITSGYRLALSYNLVHTTQSLRPALSANADLVEELRRVLSLWEREDGGNTPEKIVYLLTHTYSQSGLKASALKGVDAHKVAMMDTLAKDMGFGLGLASVECHMSGEAQDTGYHHSYWGGCRPRRGGWPFDYSDSDFGDSDREEPDEWADPDDVEKEMSITNFVDLAGKPISSTLEYDGETDTIPGELTEYVEDGVCDEQDYEGYQGNVRIFLVNCLLPLISVHVSPRSALEPFRDVRSIFYAS